MNKSKSRFLTMLVMLLILLVLGVAVSIAQDNPGTLATNTPVAVVEQPPVDTAPAAITPEAPVVPPSPTTSAYMDFSPREWIFIAAMLVLVVAFVLLMPLALYWAGTGAPRWAVEMAVQAGTSGLSSAAKFAADTENKIDDAIVAELERRFAGFRREVDSRLGVGSRDMASMNSVDIKLPQG